MKEKFEELYKKIKKISHQNPEENKGKMERRYMIAPNEEISIRKPIHYLEGIKS
jgi:t-SNARE complex subunit (syntaxin)